MAGKARTIYAFTVRDVNLRRIASAEHAEIIRTVRVMAGCALPLFNRSMKIFLSVKIFFDIAQGGSTQIVFVVAVQAGGHFVERQESLVFGIVGRVAGAGRVCQRCFEKTAKKALG